VRDYRQNAHVGLLVVWAILCLAAAAFLFAHAAKIVNRPLEALEIAGAVGLAVYAPFGERIRIVTTQGAILLRDVPDADDFVAQVRGRVPVAEG